MLHSARRLTTLFSPSKTSSELRWTQPISELSRARSANLQLQSRSLCDLFGFVWICLDIGSALRGLGATFSSFSGAHGGAGGAGGAGEGGGPVSGYGQGPRT